jgi:putative molybdopterin biosynthesis protein
VAFDPGSHLLTVYASHDDALVKLREHSARQSLHLDMRFCGSVDAIRALNEGRCTVAGFHAPLQPDASTLTARTYKPLLKTGQHKLIGFATREQGWMVAPGNPLNITGWNDLRRPELRLVNRTLGTGTRLLLDQWLENQSPSASLPTGYDQEEPSHSAVATRIASGHADLGLGIASAAHAQKLDFVPLTQEQYWLVCLKSALNNPAVIALRQVLQSAEWQQLLSQQTGYRLHEEAGQIQSLKQCLPWWPQR